MPIGWCLTVVQFGYLVLRLSERWPQWISVILITELGMSLPRWHEEFAAPAKHGFIPPTDLRSLVHRCGSFLLMVAVCFYCDHGVIVLPYTIVGQSCTGWYFRRVWYHVFW